MKFILGKKIEMTQLFEDNGRVVPVTIVEAGPCQITQVKAKDKDGYLAAQIGFGRKNKLSKPLLGHLKNLPQYRYLREFRLAEGQEVEVGRKINVSVFEEGEQVKITGVSKGKGFQGVVKRHGFHGSPASHGHKDQLRMPGSIGATDAARVFKGTRMGGRMGGDQTTIPNLEIVKIDLENNLLYIKGAVPGARNGLILIQAGGELKEAVEYTQTVSETVEQTESTEEKTADQAVADSENDNKTEAVKQADNDSTPEKANDQGQTEGLAEKAVEEKESEVKNEEISEKNASADKKESK